MFEHRYSLWQDPTHSTEDMEAATVVLDRSAMAGRSSTMGSSVGEDGAGPASRARSSRRQRNTMLTFIWCAMASLATEMPSSQAATATCRLNSFG